MKRDILYVDDETENLVVFQATFEDHFNVEISDDQLKPIRSVGDAVRLVQELQGAGAGA